jgi:hypothetical protein
MIHHPTQPVFVNPDKPPRQQHQLASKIRFYSESNLMSSILSGANVSEPNSHFIDGNFPLYSALERFKKDYSVYDKEAREQERNKQLKILEERKNLQVER